MISLTRLNNHRLVVNSDLIKFIEITPDTVITLITGEKVVVLETVDQVLNQIMEFRRRLAALPSVMTLDSQESVPQKQDEEET